MLFLSKITILHIFDHFEDHTSNKKKFVTQDATNFSPIYFSWVLNVSHKKYSFFFHKASLIISFEVSKPLKNLFQRPDFWHNNSAYFYIISAPVSRQPDHLTCSVVQFREGATTSMLVILNWIFPFIHFASTYRFI